MNATKQIKYILLSLLTSSIIASFSSSLFAADEPTELSAVVCPKRIKDERKNKTPFTWDNIRFFYKNHRVTMPPVDKCGKISNDKLKIDSSDNLTVTYAVDKSAATQQQLFNIPIMTDITEGDSGLMAITGGNFNIRIEYGIGVYELGGEKVKAVIIQDVILTDK